MSISCCPALIRRFAALLLASAALYLSVTTWIALCGTSGASTAVLIVSLVLAASVSQWLSLRFAQTLHRSVFYLYSATAAAIAVAAGLPSALSVCLNWSARLGGFGLSAMITAYSIPAVLLCLTLAVLWSIARAFDSTADGSRGNFFLQMLLMLTGVSSAGLIGVTPLMLLVLAAGISLFCQLVFVTEREVSPDSTAGVPLPVETTGREFRLRLGGGLMTGLLTLVLLQFWGLLLPLHVSQTTLLLSFSAGLLLCAEKLWHIPGVQRIISGTGFAAILLFPWLAAEIPLLFLGISAGIEFEWLRWLARASAAGGISSLLLLTMYPMRSRNVNRDFSAAGWVWSVVRGHCWV